MQVVLLVVGLGSVLLGIGMAYGGYVNFDFSYGGTLAIMAVLTILGGLLLIAAAAALGQLKRIRTALEMMQRAFAKTPAMRLSETGDPLESEEHRLPVLPPRPTRTRAAEAEFEEGAQPRGVEPTRSAQPSEMDTLELPRLTRSDRLWEGESASNGAAPLASLPPEMTGVSEDILPGQGSQGMTILKSGVIEGMAYTLYSDGSVEAELPQGIMRFASVTEWREYLRGA